MTEFQSSFQDIPNRSSSSVGFCHCSHPSPTATIDNKLFPRWMMFGGPPCTDEILTSRSWSGTRCWESVDGTAKLRAGIHHWESVLV